MIIIIGLGNPGTQYKNTRHNVGFMAVDEFAKKNDFPDFVLQKKSNSLISEKNGVLLVKPQTFMNDSGKSVKQLTAHAKEKMAHLIIIHDDIDLPVGKIKIVTERGSAGHKGVESIIKSIGNDGLIRLRIGIASPAEAGYPLGLKEGRTKAIKIVLKNFTEEEQKIISDTIQKTAEALDLFLKEGLEKAMNEYNK
jgi:peptidyl-tRNA hydrolase, PTH1 family